MLMENVVGLHSACMSISKQKLPIKTAYKLTRLTERVEKEVAFYQKEFGDIIQEFGLKENGELVLTDDSTSIKIIPGKEEECNTRLKDLRSIEVDLSGFEFTLDEFGSISLTMEEMAPFLPLIKSC